MPSNAVLISAGVALRMMGIGFSEGACVRVVLQSPSPSQCTCEGAQLAASWQSSTQAGPCSNLLLLSAFQSESLSSLSDPLNRNRGFAHCPCSGTPARPAMAAPQQQGRTGGSVSQGPTRSAGAATPNAAALAQQLAQMLSSGESSPSATDLQVCVIRTLGCCCQAATYPVCSPCASRPQFIEQLRAKLLRCCSELNKHALPSMNHGAAVSLQSDSDAQA